MRGPGRDRPPLIVRAAGPAVAIVVRVTGDGAAARHGAHRTSKHRESARERPG